MFALPFVFVIFIINFQAGLIVYWITTNVWTIGQQLLVKKLYPKPEPLDRATRRRRAGSRARQAAPPQRHGRRLGREGEAGGQAAGEGADARERRRAGNGAAGQGAAAVAAQEEEALGAPALSADRDGRQRGADRTCRRGGGRQPRRGEVGRDEGARAALSRAHGRLRQLRGGRGAGRGRAGARARARSTRRPGARRPTRSRRSRRSACARSWRASCTRSGCARRWTSTRRDDEIRATVNGDDLGLLIGKHGVDDRRPPAPGVPGGLPRRRGPQAGDRRRGRLPRAPRGGAAPAWPTARPPRRCVRPPGRARADARARSARSCTPT